MKVTVSSYMNLETNKQMQDIYVIPLNSDRLTGGGGTAALRVNDSEDTSVVTQLWKERTSVVPVQ